MQIVIERGLVKPLEDFPKYSICLDGSASGGTKIDLENNRYNFDHHSNCLRFSTASSTFQIWAAINLGFEPGAGFSIYLNDIDLDSVMGAWLLLHQDRCKEPQVRKLVDAINIADVYLGAIPLNGMTKIIDYISAPEVESKKHDDYSKLSSDGLLSIVESIFLRINSYVDGELNIENIKPHKHGEFKVIRDEKDYVVVDSADTHIYSYLYSVGYNRIVRTSKQKDGSLCVTICKRSSFISNFPIEKMLTKLLEAEIGWGGEKNTIIGSPRNVDGSRSKLPLETIIKIIDSCVE